MEFREHLLKYLSPSEVDKLIDSFSLEERKGLYLNTSKLSHDELFRYFPNIKKNPNIENGYRFLNTDYHLGSHFLFDLGAYYIQDPSAMLVGEFLPLDEGDLILDMCSAPGGKLTEISLRLKDKGMIIGNDASYSRAMTLLENVERMGLDNVIVTNLDFRNKYKDYRGYFSKIVLDAPCSGSGMFRKDDKMMKDWTYEKVLKNQAIQKELVDASLYMLKEGGYLIYSTCSYSYEEDEEIVKYILKDESMELINLPSVIGEYRYKEYPETMHLFPSLHEGEGQYIALFRKKGTLINNKLEEITYTRKGVNKGNKPIVYTYKLNMKINPKLLDLAIRSGTLLYTSYLDGSNKLYEHHYVRTLSKDKLTNISYENMEKYMMGETLNLLLDDGDYFLGYNDISIGYLSVKKGQCKNHYPKGLRKKIYR